MFFFFDNDVNARTFTMPLLLYITNALLLVFNLPTRKKPYQKNVNASTYLKHCTVTFNLNKRTACLRPLLLRNLPSSFPRRALKHLGKRKLFMCQREFRADGSGNPITGNDVTSQQ